MTKKLLLSALCICMTALASSYASAATTCVDIWQQINADSTLPLPEQKAEAMKLRGQECMKDAGFVYQLTYFYMQAKDWDAAAAEIDPIFKEQPSLQLVAYRVAYIAYSKGDLDTADKVASKLIKDFPRFDQPFLILGGVEAQRGHFFAAKEFTRKAYDLSGDPQDLLLMAMSLYQMQSYDQVVLTVNQALEKDPSLVGRTMGINEAINSLGALGRFDEATKLAKQHMDADPNWQKNEDFVKLARALKLTE